ncbi:MAG: PspC domain-containing protein [Candidatus Woesebacteria bacterium]
MKKLMRPKKGRKVAGVCLAFSNYFDVDITLVRLFFVILGLPGGAPGIILYVACWLVIPEQ